MEFCEHVQKAAMIPLFFFEKYLDLASDRYDIARLSQTHIHALSLFFFFFSDSQAYTPFDMHWYWFYFTLL